MVITASTTLGFALLFPLTWSFVCVAYLRFVTYFLLFVSSLFCIRKVLVPNLLVALCLFVPSLIPCWKLFGFAILAFCFFLDLFTLNFHLFPVNVLFLDLIFFLLEYTQRLISYYTQRIIDSFSLALILDFWILSSSEFLSLALKILFEDDPPWKTLQK